jgi:hypothetical protein
MQVLVDNYPALVGVVPIHYLPPRDPKGGPENEPNNGMPVFGHAGANFNDAKHHLYYADTYMVPTVYDDPLRPPTKTREQRLESYRSFSDRVRQDMLNMVVDPTRHKQCAFVPGNVPEEVCPGNKTRPTYYPEENQPFPGNTQNGSYQRRCGMYAEHGDVCKFHAVNVFRVFVADSKIPDGGKGLFARYNNPDDRDPAMRTERVFKKHDVIAYYNGRTISRSTAARLQNSEVYLWASRLRKDIVVDGNNVHTCLGRFANDGFGENNCDIQDVNLTEYGFGALVAARDIYEGEEIFCEYGAVFWADKDPAKLGQHFRDFLARMQAYFN